MAVLVVLVQVHLILRTPPPNPPSAVPLLGTLVWGFVLATGALLFALVLRVVPLVYLWAVVGATAVVGSLLSLSGGLGKAAVLFGILMTDGSGSLIGAGLAAGRTIS